MADPVKCVLLVDYDGLRRSLAAEAGDDVADRLSGRLDDWAGAIESGELIGPAGATRTLALRRCYINRAEAADAAKAYEQAGFEIVDGDGATSPDLRIAVDAMDAVIDAAGPTDIVLLATAPDLSPLVERLQTRGHRVAIYADNSTAADYRAAADVVLGAADFATFLTEGRLPEPPAAKSAVERGKIEAFAREIHAATSIPLFSPKTFAELFHHLAEEVTASGYHFQDTARNVADRLESSGRNVTPRQVVFVVKGLALKGHVFSTTDTAKSLAEVFREQARYLIGGAGITLDEEREALLAAWIAAPATARDQQAPARPAKPAPPKPAAKPPEAKSAARQPDNKSARPAGKPQAAKPAAPARPPERPKSAALPPKQSQLPAKPGPKSPGEVRAAIAARIAASAKLKPSNRPAAPPPKPAAPKAAPPADEPDPIESSILAAIAEAVDVLVEDSGGDAEKSGSGKPARAKPRPTEERDGDDQPAREQTALPSPEGKPPADEGEDGGGDIGDEIQRIVASYNRNRKDDDRGG